MFANGDVERRPNVTPQHAIGPNRLWRTAGFLVMWVALLAMVLPASAFASPMAATGAAAIPGAPTGGAAIHDGALSAPTSLASSHETLLGSNPDLNTPSNGPGIAAANYAQVTAAGGNYFGAPSAAATGRGSTSISSGISASAQLGTAASHPAPTPMSPTPSTSVPGLIVGNVSGQVVSSITGLPLQGVSVQVYSVGSAVCSVKVCAQVFTNYSGDYVAVGPAGADYVQFTLNWNLTNETYVTVYQGVTVSAGITQLVPDGLAWGYVRSNTTSTPSIDGVTVCATSRDQAVEAQPCEDTISNGSYIVPVPPFPSVVTYTPVADFLTDFRFANATPHRAGEPLLDLGTVYLTRLVDVQVNLIDAVTLGNVPSNVNGNPMYYAITVCSSITGSCETQGNTESGSSLTAMAAPGPSYVIAYGTGYVTNDFNIGNVTKLQPGHAFSAGKIPMVPLGSATVDVQITMNKSGSDSDYSTGLWRVSTASMNGYVTGSPIQAVFGGINMTSTGTISGGGCKGVGQTGALSLFPGRNDIVLTPDYTPTCSLAPTWPIPSDFPVWGNETWVNGTPDENVNIGWLNLTPGTYIYGHVYTQGQTFAPRNYTVVAASTESNSWTTYPFTWNYVYQYSGKWDEEYDGWGCSEAITNESFCVAAPPGDTTVQVSANNMPTNETWTFTHNICCNGTRANVDLGVPLNVATLSHVQSINMTPQGGIYGNVFRNGSNLGVAFGIVQVCSAMSDSVTPGVSCFNGVVETNGAFLSAAPLGWDFITATASGFEPNTVWAYVNGNHIFVGNISLQPVATLQGYVVGPTGGLLEAQVKTCLLSSTNACNLLGIGETETDGLYNGTILGGWLPWSTYEVQASASGYSTDWTFVNATPGQSTTVPTIHLTAVGSQEGSSVSGVWVWGTIIDNSTGYGVETTQIQACSVTSTGDCTPFVEGSNSLGQFNESLLPGIYNLTVSAPGYAPITVEFNITDVPGYDFGTLQMVPFPWVNGTSWYAPWDNVTVSYKGSHRIQLSAPATVIACNTGQSVCGVGLPQSTQGTFFVNTPAGNYDIVTVNPSGTATSTTAPGGEVGNNSIYNTTGFVTNLNVTVPLNVFASVYSEVRDNSSINPGTGARDWLPVQFTPASITTFGPAHTTVTWSTNGGGWDIWFVPPGVNRTVVASSNGIYTNGNTSLNSSLWPGLAYNMTYNISVQHFGFINFQLVDSVTGLPIQYAGASSFYYDKLNNTVYSANAVSNGVGLVNLTSMFGTGVYVHVGADQDYNSSTYYTDVNESATTFSPVGATNTTVGFIALDHWGYVASQQLNNSTGITIPTIMDQTHGAPVPGVSITVTSTDSGVYGAGSSQDTSYAGQFFSDAPIGKADILETQRYAYLANTSSVTITPDLYVAKPTINVTADGVVAGLVVGLPSGTPISGASVSLCTAKGVCYTTLTNQSGVFWVLAAPDVSAGGLDSVTATADGFVTNSSDKVLAKSDTWTWMGTISLSQFAYVYGLVRGLPAGLPLNMADAALCSPLGNPVGACGFLNITGQNGQFLLTAPAGTYVLETSASDYNATYRPIAISPGQHASVGTIFLEEFGTLQGFVYSGTTLAAVQGAQVYACAQWGGGSCTAPQGTASTGSFVVRSAPGPYVLTVSAPGFADAYVPAFIQTGGISSMLPILLTPLGTDAAFEVSGLVVNASNPSQGVGGAIVSLSLGSALAVSTQADASGAFSFSAIYGSYTMTIAAPGYRPLVRPLVVNGPTSGLQLSLAVMEYQVTGIASDGLNGQALGGVSFSEISNSVSTLLGLSASDGSFTLDLANGSHIIVAQYSGLNSYTPLTFSIVIDGASQVHNVGLVPSNEIVYGIVADSVSGLAIPNAVVTIHGVATDGFPITKTTTSDASGAITVYLPAGSYTATTAPTGYYAVSFNFVVATSSEQLQFNLVPNGLSAGAVGTSGGSTGLAPLVLGLVGVAAVAVLAGAYLLRASQRNLGSPTLVRSPRPTPSGVRGTQ